MHIQRKKYYLDSEFQTYIRGSFNKSLENPRDSACNIENGLVLVSIITH